MKKEKTIELIKKVLAKTKNNDNEKEVEVAFMKAQELMIKHGVSMDEVDIEDKKREAKSEEVDDKESIWYREQLGIVVCNNFKCEPIISSQYINGKFRKRLRFIGLEEDVLIAKEVFNFTVSSLEYFTNKYIRLEKCKNLTEDKVYKPSYYTGIRNDFMRGFIEGLRKKYEEQVKENEWGLMIVKPVEVTEFIENLNVKKKKSSTIKSNGSSEHFSNGFKEGKSLEHRKDLIG